MRKPFSSNSFYLLILRKITNSVTKITIFPRAWRKIEKSFFVICTWSNLSRLQFEGKSDVWISQVRRVVSSADFDAFSFLCTDRVNDVWISHLLCVSLVFCYQNFSDLQWEKIVLVIEKNFWNSRLKAENFQNVWDH